MFSIICPTANLLNNTDPGVQTTHLSKTFYVFKFRLFYKNPRREEISCGDCMRCGCVRLVLGGAFQLLHDGEDEDGGDDAEGDED